MLARIVLAWRDCLIERGEIFTVARSFRSFHISFFSPGIPSIPRIFPPVNAPLAVKNLLLQTRFSILSFFYCRSIFYNSVYIAAFEDSSIVVAEDGRYEQFQPRVSKLQEGKG